MMTSLRRRHVGLTVSVLAGVLAGPLGCARPTSEIEFVSYKDPYFPEPYRVVFVECTYRVDADGDLHIAGRADFDSDQRDAGAITQYFHAHVFWQPRPGRTFANSTTTDATIRHVIVTADGMAAYAGTGFIYPRRRRGGLLTAKIETANLRLEAQTGDAPELLGDARLRGTLRARRDDHATLDLVRRLEFHAAGGHQP